MIGRNKRSNCPNAPASGREDGYKEEQEEQQVGLWIAQSAAARRILGRRTRQNSRVSWEEEVDQQKFPWIAAQSNLAEEERDT